MAKAKKAHRRPSTCISADGETVTMRLRVSRAAYDFALHWARFHGEAVPDGTAEDQLEGYLEMAMTEAMEQAGWPRPPAEPGKPRGNDLDDNIPF